MAWGASPFSIITIKSVADVAMSAGFGASCIVSDLFCELLSDVTQGKNPISI